MCRTVTLIIEFKLLNRMEKIYRLYPLIHYGDFCRFWNLNWYIEKSIYQTFRYWSGRHDTILYRYRNDIGLSIFSIYQPISNILKKRRNRSLSHPFWTWGNVRTPSFVGKPVVDFLFATIEFFRYLLQRLSKGWLTLSANFRQKGASSTNCRWCRSL